MSVTEIFLYKCFIDINYYQTNLLNSLKIAAHQIWEFFKNIEFVSFIKLKHFNNKFK